MNHAPDLIPDRIRTLWQGAMSVIAHILYRFDRARLRAGIRRSAGVRISVALNEAEAALRRLILIAALAFTPPQPSPRKPQASAPRASREHPPTFRVFRLYGSGASTRRPISHKPSEPSAHIRFRADPILALGRLPVRRPTHRHNGGPILPRHTRRNPLDRWVRLSRNDPDWRPPEEPDPLLHWLDYRVVDVAPSEDDEPRKRKRNPPRRLDSTADWRRCHDEWERLVPAPQLAARLDALERASSNPEAFIRRTARRLQSQRERTLALARAAWPPTDLPRRARQVDTTGFDTGMALDVHDHIDSS